MSGAWNIIYRLFTPLLAVFVIAGGVVIVGEFAKNDSSATLSQSVEQTYPGDNKISPNAPYLAAANVGQSSFIADIMTNWTNPIYHPQCYFRPELESGKSFPFNCETAQADAVRKIGGGGYGAGIKIEGNNPLDLCELENNKQSDKYNLNNKDLCYTLVAMGYERKAREAMWEGDKNTADAAHDAASAAATAATDATDAAYYAAANAAYAAVLAANAAKDKKYCSILEDVGKMVEKSQRDVFRYIGNNVCKNKNNNNKSCSEYDARKADAESKLREMKKAINGAYNRKVFDDVDIPRNPTGICVGVKQTTKDFNEEYIRQCKSVGGTLSNNEKVKKGNICKCGLQVISPLSLEQSGGTCEDGRIVCKQDKTYKNGKCVPKQKTTPATASTSSPTKQHPSQQNQQTCKSGEETKDGKCVTTRKRPQPSKTSKDSIRKIQNQRNRALQEGKTFAYTPIKEEGKKYCFYEDTLIKTQSGSLMCVAGIQRRSGSTVVSRADFQRMMEAQKRKLEAQRQKMIAERDRILQKERAKAEEALRRQAQNARRAQMEQERRYKEALRRQKEQAQLQIRRAQQRAQQQARKAQQAQRAAQNGQQQRPRQSAPPTNWFRDFLNRLRNNRQPQFPPIVAKPQCMSFTADKLRINSGDEITLQWAVTGATKIIITPQVRVVNENGKTVAKANPRSNVKYTLIAVNAKGEESRCQTKEIMVGDVIAPDDDLSCDTQINDVNIDTEPQYITRPACDPEIDQQTCDNQWQGKEIKVKWSVDPKQCVTSCKIQLKEENGTDWVDVWTTPYDLRYTLDSSQPGFSNKGLLRKTSTFRLLCEDGLGNIKQDTAKAEVREE